MDAPASKPGNSLLKTSSYRRHQPRLRESVARIHPLTVIAAPDQVQVARRHVAAALGPDHPCLDAATEVISELVTNAMQYGSTGPDAKIDVHVQLLRRGRVYLCVTDEGGTGLVPVVRRPDEGALAGRGLLIVASLAYRWNWMRDGAGHKIRVLLDPRHPGPQGGTAPDPSAFVDLDGS